MPRHDPRSTAAPQGAERLADDVATSRRLVENGSPRSDKPLACRERFPRSDKPLACRDRFPQAGGSGLRHGRSPRPIGPIGPIGHTGAGRRHRPIGPIGPIGPIAVGAGLPVGGSPLHLLHPVAPQSLGDRSRAVAGPLPAAIQHPVSSIRLRKASADRSSIRHPASSILRSLHSPPGPAMVMLS